MVIHDGIGHTVVSSTVVLYKYDGTIGSRYREFFQGAINRPVGLYRQIGLMSNVVNFKRMMCHPGKIRLGMSEEAVGWQSTGKGST